MKTTFKNKIQKLIAGLLIFSVGLLIVNNVVFLHSHKLSNGKIIVHAHPYNKSQDSAPFKKHNHTSKELFHISHIQLLFVSVVFAILIRLSIAYNNIYFNQTPSVHTDYFFRLKGRDPPQIPQSLSI